MPTKGKEPDIVTRENVTLGYSCNYHYSLISTTNTFLKTKMKGREEVFLAHFP